MKKKQTKKGLRRGRIKRRPTSSTKADALFSRWIRDRDGKCVRCGKKENLQNSHFWPRAWSSTRYDPQNCDALCYGCHYGNSQGWERAKQGEYRDFKMKQLGLDGYNELEKRARMLMPRTKAIEAFMQFYEEKIREIAQ